MEDLDDQMLVENGTDLKEETQDEPKTVEENGGDDLPVFPVIGSLKQAKSVKVRSILPKWITHAIQFAGSDIQANQTELDILESSIDSRIINSLRSNGFAKLFPVQVAVIPQLVKSFSKMEFIQPQDVCVLSPTGSGKTLTYIVPIVNHLLHRVVTQIRALIILPVSDLATQVYRNFQTICKGTTLRVALATSSTKNTTNFYKKKVDNSGGYLSLVDILVATPGKLIDLIHQEGFSLEHLEILVLDEADRMMNETQFDWLKEIEYSIYKSNNRHPCPCSVSLTNSPNKLKHYNMNALSACSITDHSSVRRKFLHKTLFSATINTDPEKLESLSLYDPIMFSNTVSNVDGNKSEDPLQTIPVNLKEKLVIIDSDKKPLALWHLIEEYKYDKILCFTDSVESTHRLYNLMKKMATNFVVVEFSSNQHVRQREKILKQFRAGTVNMIISTDIFARGLDLSNIGCVVCYDPPRNDTAYIHRVGRTARAGQEGTAITLITREQLKHFTIVSRRAHKFDQKEIERLKIIDSKLKPLMDKYQEALKGLEQQIRGEASARLGKRKRQIGRSKFSFERTSNDREKKVKKEE